jgi:oligosaccharyltransferase complex subunit beta
MLQYGEAADMLAAFAPDITPQSLVSLLSSKVNLMIALSQTQTPLTGLALEFGLTPPPPETPLISHFPPRAGPPTIIPISTSAQNPILTTTQPFSTVLFSGIPFSLSTSPLIMPALHAPRESFATDTDTDAGFDVIVDAAEKGGEGLWAGSTLATVVAFQAVSGARITWAGGVSVFGDEFANSGSVKWAASCSWPGFSYHLGL